MSEWYEDNTANTEHELEIMDLYSGYKQTSLTWQERAERMKALAASRLEMLREMHEVIVAEPLECPVCGVSGCRDDGLCKLADELGDD